MSNNKKIFIIIFICLLLVAIGWFYYDYQNKKFEIVFFDIGQGDSTFINFPGNNEILIDGGPDSSVLYKLGKYMPIYDRSIELMVLSHPHADHTTGLVETLNRYKVKQVLYTGVKYDSGIYKKFVDLIRNLAVESPEIGKIDFGKGNFLEIIYPFVSVKGVKFKDVNESSIVFILNLENGRKILFTGDINIKVEKEILDRISLKKLNIDILKVAHQGSDTSSCKEFLHAISPKWAVISVGADNNYGHRSLRVIRRLERIGAKIFSTDKDGDIVFKMIDGKLKVDK